jgi:hypothetical protein
MNRPLSVHPLALEGEGGRRSGEGESPLGFQNPMQVSSTRGLSLNRVCEDPKRCRTNALQDAGANSEVRPDFARSWNGPTFRRFPFVDPHGSGSSIGRLGWAQRFPMSSMRC